QDGPNFLGIEDVKEDNLVAVEAQRLDGANDAFWRLVEIGNDHHQAAPAEKLLKVAHRLAEVGARARLGELESAQEPGELPLARRRPDVVAHLVVEAVETRSVALIVDGKIEERGGDVAGVT